MTDLKTAARKLCDAVEFDMNGRDGRGGNGGLMSDATLRACHEVQAILNQGPDVFQIGDRTMALVFTPAGLTDVSDLQKVFDVIEAALSTMDEERHIDLLRDHCVSCSKMLEPGDLVYVEHGEGGYICADCTGDDPESFVGEDGEPLKPGEPIPTPFEYDR